MKNKELRYMVVEQLIEIRKVHNLSQLQLAEKLRVSESLISEIEKGMVDISIDFIYEFSCAFDKKVEIKWT